MALKYKIMLLLDAKGEKDKAMEILMTLPREKFEINPFPATTRGHEPLAYLGDCPVPYRGIAQITELRDKLQRTHNENKIPA